MLPTAGGARDDLEEGTRTFLESFEGSEEDQRERRRTFDIELILWGTNSDHSGDRSPPRVCNDSRDYET